MYQYDGILQPWECGWSKIRITKLRYPGWFKPPGIFYFIFYFILGGEWSFQNGHSLLFYSGCIEIGEAQQFQFRKDILDTSSSRRCYVFISIKRVWFDSEKLFRLYQVRINFVHSFRLCGFKTNKCLRFCFNINTPWKLFQNGCG